MYSIVGNCPRCGAPIYAPTINYSILPPPSRHSCNCFAGGSVYVTGTGQEITNKPVPIWKQANKTYGFGTLC